MAILVILLVPRADSGDQTPDKDPAVVVEENGDDKPDPTPDSETPINETSSSDTPSGETS